MKLSDLLEEYLIELEVKNYAPSTIENTSYAISQFIRYSNDAMVNDVTGVMIKKFIIEQKKQVKSSTLNTRLIITRNMLSYGLEQGLLTSNPFTGISLLKEDKTRIRTYSDTLVMDVLDRLKGRDYYTVRNKTILILLIETGVRNSELCNIRLQDLSEGSIRIMGKGRKVRYVPITKALSLQLRLFKRVRDTFLKGSSNEYLFLSRIQAQLTRNTLLEIIKKQIFKGLDSSVATNVHNFRRYYAQAMLDNVDLYTVSKLLGHTDIKTTERYVRGMEDSKLIEKGMLSPLSKRM